jgi:GT2 family glycosyltransferase/Tfp pilus assembly protein PilF
MSDQGSPLPFGLATPPADYPQKPPGISLCMIVKNEERFLAQCLRSVADVVDEMIIVDTGSTDRTIEIAKSFGATVVEREWRNDFAWARNQALELATKRWIFSLDADEELTSESKPALLQLKTVPAYREAIWVRFFNQSDDYKGTGAMSHALVRIFPNDPEIRFRGLIHEFPTIGDSPNGLPGAMLPISIIHHGYLKDVVADRDKGARNLALVKAATEQEPDDPFHWFNLGSTAFLVGDYELAVSALEHMRAVNGNQKRGFIPNALSQLAELYSDKFGDIAKGEEIAREALRLSPHYANAHFQLGKILMAQRRFDEGREALAAAIADGEFAHLQFVIDDQVYRWKAHSEMGSSYVMQGDDESAITWFKKGLANAPGVEPLQVNLGRALDRLGRYSQAERVFREAYEMHRSETSTIDYVNFLLRRGNGLGALAVIDQAHEGLRKDDIAANLLLAAAQVAEKNGLQRSRHYLELAAKRAPGSADILNPLEQIYRESGDDAALAALLAAERSTEPATAADFTRRSYQALGVGDYERALHLALRGLEIDPRVAGMRYNAALALTHLGRKTESESHLALIEPSEGDVYVAAALLRAANARDRGDASEALRVIDALLKAVPDLPDALSFRAALLEARGDAAGAESSLRALMERERRRGAVELASFLMRAGRFEEAAVVADRGLTVLDYSIIIPVFNKAALTRQCLEALRPSLDGAGEGEVIVVDNASSDETASMLEEFPWVKVIRNDTNLGYAAANNQGARAARGTYLVLLNNDTKPLPGWLSSMMMHARTGGVGVVGARLLYGDNLVQHAGTAICGVFFSKQSFVPFHINHRVPADDFDVVRVRDMPAVTGACLLTPRDLYLELGGLDETFWNGYEDVDYCLKVRERGLRVVYDGRAVLYHFESQSGAQRFRKQVWNSDVLAERWRGKVPFDGVTTYLSRGSVRHASRTPRGGLSWYVVPVPPVTVVVHGAIDERERERLERTIRSSRVPVTSILWTGDVASGFDEVAERLRARGLKYVAFVDARAELADGWLEELVRQLEATTTCGAATFSPDAPIGENVRVLAPDARCTLLSMQKLPAHLQIRRFDTWNGVIADLAMRALPLGVGTRGCGRVIANLPPLVEDESFALEHGRPIGSLYRDDERAIEAALTPVPRKRGLVSIITLSWNAPQFTKIALDSIRRHATEPYEVIVVDNGSGPETLEMLRAIDDPHVRVIYNPTNRGFAGGNNDGLRVASGEYVILLNNDVVVTEGWIEGLLRPFAKIPALGVTAPRSNRVVGDQVVYDANYQDIDELDALARARRGAFRDRGYITDRAIGLCLCVSREVLEQIGGLDENYGVGNFEDDDFCLRVRAAGYKIFVCDDVFIHHYGSQSFKANNVDYMATMRSNWAIFAAKWGYSPEYPTNGYHPHEAILRGFDPLKHVVPIAASGDGGPRARVAFLANLDDDASWERVAGFMRRYLQAFSSADDTVLSIAPAGGSLSVDVLERRVERAREKLGISRERMARVVIGAASESERTIDIATVEDASPSGLRRMIEPVAR